MKRTGTTRPLVIRGRIATLEGASGFGWRPSITINDDVLGPVGLPAPADAYAVDLDADCIVTPALTDAHLHLGMVADARLAISLETDESIPAVRNTLRKAVHEARKHDSWIVGHGLRVDQWRRWPRGDEFEDIAPRRPIVLWAHDHHSIWASRAATELANVDRDTVSPPGGEIGRDSTGELTGVFVENARELVLRAVPTPDEDARLATLNGAAESLLELGLVTVHDPGPMVLDPSLRALKLLQRADEASLLPIEVTLSLRPENLDAAAAEGLVSGTPLSRRNRPRAYAGWLKVFADGTLSSGTAAAGSGGRERLVYSSAELRGLVRHASKLGFATQIHAIGDVAVGAALDALRATRSTPLRHRIEHAQLVDPADLDRFGRMGVAASVQPVHQATDEALASKEWATSQAVRYPWASFLRSGALLLIGTDAPVEAPDPWRNLAIAITRRDHSSNGPGERLRPAEALRAATVGPAVSMGRLDRGRLVAGHRADLVVLRRSRLRTASQGTFCPEAVVAGGLLVAGDLPGWPDARRSSKHRAVNG